MLLKRKYLFGTTILAGVIAAAMPAMAQDTGSQDPGASEVDEIIITGSRIRRDPTNAPTPLIQVSREQLTETGQSSVIDYLATIPALSNSVVPSDTTGSLNIGGVSLPNLRSLGSGRTLTLVDGRRHVGATAGSLAVDIDSIPRLLIENIEIVTGGASSIYGADAVSGVLNFVLRNDFDGLEIDANIGMINQGGELNRRFSALFGTNLLDDRLNVYVHGEYDKNDEVQSLDIDWLEAANIQVITDYDPTATPSDGFVDRVLFSNVRRMDRPRWGQTTLANTQPGSPLNDPDVAYLPCSNALTNAAITNANCYNVTPGLTYYYDGATGRLADFGTRIGQPINGTTSSRPLNIGGDGENPNNFAAESRIPETESRRFQAGSTFEVTPDIDFYVEAKYVEEETYFTSQPTFYDAFINNQTYGPTDSTNVRSNTQFDLRTDNAFLPANVRAAIEGNMMTTYTAPTATTGSVATGTVANPRARHSLFGPQRSQDNAREVERYVASLSGDVDSLLFVDNISWEVAYVKGEARNLNIETGTDSMRFAYAADAVVDSTGAVNGTPGEIVCRIQLNAALGSATNFDRLRGGQFTATPEGTRELEDCQPLNIFGIGNQSQAALDYVGASIFVAHTNEQEQGLAFVSGQMWDFFGAGPLGVAVGAEYRREYTEGVGRSASTGNRLLLLNTGADFPGAEYETEEAFAELSIPLLRDSWLGEYAELSGSYRFADYTTVGETEVYGVNLVYRPIQDIAFKTSFNTSIRVPNLAENFSPLTQTFANGFNDPCATTNIVGQTNTEIRNNRIANCQTLLNQYNTANGTALTFDFGGATPGNGDDFVPTYTSGVAGVNGGNPFLQPEESESFTVSAVIEPRFFPDLTLILDYYEIEITNVIASVTAQTAANNCVNSVGLTQAACDTIFRRDPNPGRGFYVGAATGHPVGGFIQGSINYAKLSTRGLDFTARYSLDLEEQFGLNWGRLDYSVGGLWLIEQKQFLNAANAAAFTELSSGVFYPRVRLTSSLTYTPNDTWSVNWTMDWQTAQDLVNRRDLVNNLDFQSTNELDTGNFARHDFTVRYRVNDELSIRTGVVNAFDAEQAQYISNGANGSSLASNFDPYGTRFFFGLNYRPF